MPEKGIRRTHKDLMEFLGLEVDTPIKEIDIHFDNIDVEWIIIVKPEVLGGEG